MGRITEQERQRKFQELDAHVWEVFKEGGWYGLTYQRLSEVSGYRKSTIQGYFPSNAEFIDSIVGKAFPEMLPFLDLTSVETFLETWTLECLKPAIRHYTALIMLDATVGLNGSFAKQAINNVVEFLSGSFGLSRSEALHTFKYMMGHSIMVQAGLETDVDPFFGRNTNAQS
ncbi:hypothetical protein L4C33_13755 [Vibrio makurazakiensis]|uniref:hypothetical protein n=1 Tax=Vibrio makurazakiensis TaxID=2910250 RepID=UPI003D129A31